MSKIIRTYYFTYNHKTFNSAINILGISTKAAEWTWQRFKFSAGGINTIQSRFLQVYKCVQEHIFLLFNKVKWNTIDGRLFVYIPLLSNWVVELLYLVRSFSNNTWHATDEFLEIVKRSVGAASVVFHHQNGILTMKIQVMIKPWPSPW